MCKCLYQTQLYCETYVFIFNSQAKLGEYVYTHYYRPVNKGLTSPSVIIRKRFPCGYVSLGCVKIPSLSSVLVWNLKKWCHTKTDFGGSACTHLEPWTLT